jgi:hypothetical protein
VDGATHELLLGTSHFQVFIGREEFGFAEVTRLTSATDLDTPPDARRHYYETVVLRRALTDSRELYEWRRRIAAGERDLRSVTIRQLSGPGGRPVNAWRLVRAWPCRWSGPAFDALKTGIAYEEIELAFDDLVWVARSGRARRHSTEGA